MQEAYSVSERRACQVSGQHRSTQRYAARTADDEEALLGRIAELVRANPRRGCRYISRELRLEGWRVNYKRVHRLWKREGYKVPQKRRKKRALGAGVNACYKRTATRPNEVWSWDFVHDRLVDGRAIKLLVIVDEYTRECLALRVERSITGEDVLDTLSELFAQRGRPAYIRSDNGPEFIAKKIRGWLASLEVETLFIEPGAPWQNAYAESFNSRLRDEFLEMNYFHTLAEAQELARRWKEEYNTQRKHGRLGHTTPAEFARLCGASSSASLRSATLPAPQSQPAGANTMNQGLS